MNATITTLVGERARRVAIADRNALAYLYCATAGVITIGPGECHESSIVLALVQRLHPQRLVRGDAMSRTLRITDEGRRVVDHWISEISDALSHAGRERVLESRRWIGAPTISVDEELEQHQLVRRRVGGRDRTLEFLNYTWRTDLCVVLARALAKAGGA